MPVATLAVLKKLSPACTAEAATSVVPDSVVIALFKRRIEIAGGRGRVGADGEASGRRRRRVGRRQLNRRRGAVGQIEIERDLVAGIGIGGAERDRLTAAGEPDGPVTVAPVSDDDTVPSFRPNGEPATSSPTWTEVAVGCEITSRPVPVVPSACARSAITVFNPAWVLVPFMMVPAGAVAGVLIALPENR